MGGDRASMGGVAEAAGVAMSSVSRVPSGHPDVSSAVRERVNAAVEPLGYRPDLLAQSVRRRASRSIRFISAKSRNPLLAEIALGAETKLRAAGYTLMSTNSENDPEVDAHHIELLCQWRVDRLLLSLTSEEHPATLALLEEIDVPVVLGDPELSTPGSVTAPSPMLADHRSGMRDAVGHLLDLGHRRMGLILGRRARYSRERLAGMCDAHRQRGLAQTCAVDEAHLDSAQRHGAIGSLLDDEDPATAIVVGGNQLLIGPLQDLRQRGVWIGEDVLVVRCDAIAPTELSDPPIAVVRRDLRELGQTATELLLKLITDDGELPETIVLQTEFVPRASCRSPRG